MNGLSLYACSWHSSAIKMRINRYCHAASLLKLTELSSLSGCKGMQDSYEECMADGTCKYCEEFPPPRNNTATNISEEGESVETDTSSANDASEEEEVQNSETPTKMPTSTKESSSASSPPTISEQQSSASSPPTSPGKPTPTTSSTNVSLNETPPSTSSPTISLEQPSPATSSPTVLSSNNSTTQQPSLLLSTSPPTISPTTSETENPIPPTTLEPSYAPTTPQPTMGPCDGEPCPGKLCRSLWGFCGGGDGYCNDNAVWSPSCKDNSEPPTLPPAGASAITDSLSLAPSALSTFRLHSSDNDSTTELPTKSPIGYGYGFDTDYGYGYDAASEKLTSSPTDAASEKPTSSPTDTVVKTFVKPQPGKKPPPGRSKPTSTSENSSESSGKTSTTEEQVSVKKSPPPTTSPVREGTNQPTNPPNNMPPTLHPTIKEYSPTDPESTYYCGKSWANANEDCRIRCPSAKSEDCPEGMSCYAFTTCNDTKQPTSSPISSAIDEIPENAGEIDSMIIAAPETANLPDTTVPASTNESTANSDGCTGSPCPVAGECRSEYGFCGATFIYCNTLSSWTFENCGLFGTNDDGDTILCDADVFECPDGKHVQQDPSNGCEYFACPVEEKTSSILSTPVSSPTLPELPKPTLPIISNPEKQTLDSKPAVGSQHNIVLPSLGSKPAKGSQPIVIGGEKDKVEDDIEEPPKESNNAESDTARPIMENSVQFTAETWLMSGGLDRTSAKFQCLSMMAISLTIALVIDT